MRSTRSTGLTALTAVFAAGLAATTAPVSAQGWSTTPWKLYCVDPSPCAPVDAAYRLQLEEANRWLDGLGFKKPRLTLKQGILSAFVKDSELRDCNDPAYETICESDPNMFNATEGFSEVRYLVKEGDESRGWKDLERGKDVGASLWDGPSPFRVPQLCADILARDPVATGTARVRINMINVHFVEKLDAKGRSKVDFIGQGTMTKDDGTEITVLASAKCNYPAGEGIDTVYECRSNVDVR